MIVSPTMNYLPKNSYDQATPYTIQNFRDLDQTGKGKVKGWYVKAL